MSNSTVYYKTLRGRDQRKLYFKFHKVHFRQTVLYCPQSALLHRKECFIAIKHSLWAIKHSCPHVLVQANGLQRSRQYD